MAEDEAGGPAADSTDIANELIEFANDKLATGIDPTVIAEALRDFDERVAPELEALTFSGFRNQPVNNATLLSRIRYYKRLPDFGAFLARHDGDLVQALADLKERAPQADDAFDLLTLPGS